MNTIHSANVFVKKEYDKDTHESFVVIEEVKIYDIDKEEIKEKDRTNNFIGEKAKDIFDFVLGQNVAEKLEIDDSKVEIKYI